MQIPDWVTARPSDRVFAVLVAACKVQQQLNVLFWANLLVPSDLLAKLQGLTMGEAVSVGVLVGMGVLLNWAIYRAIGKKGVYYGFKLGRPVPWCEGFPFSLVDRVVVPTDLEAGDYLLSWRWDCEMTHQVWQNCADVRLT